jgi:pimeloyl-ACP methyl ester carboxylesterase
MYLFASILGSVAALAAAGILYQWIGAKRDRARLRSTGHCIPIAAGSGLYLLEKGAGGPTVLFESGIAATHLNWFHIQQTLAEHTHTVSYDRAGLGWSSPPQTPRTPANIALELHTLLAAAGIQPPFILVGHSFGGLVMRRYAQLFPNEVAGIVLVDPMRCEEWPPLDPSKQATVDRGVKMSGYAVPIAQSGLARLAVTSLLCGSGRVSRFLSQAAGNGGRHVLARIQDEVDKMPPEIRPAIAAHWSRPSFFQGMAAHIATIPESVREMLATMPISGIPITLLTPGKAKPLSDDSLAEIGDAVKQIVVPNSAHWIHLDQPEVVVESIRAMITAAKSQSVSVAP